MCYACDIRPSGVFTAMSKMMLQLTARSKPNERTRVKKTNTESVVLISLVICFVGAKQV